MRKLKIDPDDLEAVIEGGKFISANGALSEARQILLSYLERNRWNNEARGLLNRLAILATH